MWLFPVAAAVVASVFAWALARRWVERRRPAELAWAIALAMYAIASVALAWGVIGGFSREIFAAYWIFGAVLNVPFLAAGEVMLLSDRAWVRWACWALLVFVTAYTVTVVAGAATFPGALLEELPSGKEVYGAGTPAHQLPQLISVTSYLILVAGALFSAWRMRGRPELRRRFAGTLLIVAGATVVALGSAFAATGVLIGFSLTLLAGIVLMFAGFRMATTTRRTQPADA
jgi:hypothetical protein